MASDIELNGAGYMVAPGSYWRSSDGAAEATPGKVVLTDFYGGQRRALFLERDQGWDAVGVGPALGGQGVEPWPFIQAYTDPALTTVTTVRAPHLVVDPYAYVAVGRYLYRSVALSASSWGNFTQVADVGAGRTITRLAAYQGNIALCCGNGLDVQLYPAGGGGLMPLAAGLKARVAVGYANRLIYGDPTPGSEQILRMTTGGTPDSRELDAPIVTMGLHAGKVAIATRQSLWLLGGRADPTTNLWTAEPEPFFTHGVGADDEDFLFLLSYGGRLYTWLANGVMEWNPSGQKQGWRATGLEGRSCTGATVAGDRLIVSIVNRAGESEVWAYDGAGWWLTLRSASQTRVWPMYTGGAGNVDLVVFRDGSASVTYDLMRLVYRHESATSYNSGTSEYRTSLLDGGARERVKAWQRVGAVFAAPETRGNSSSTDLVTATLALSTDGGRSWTTAGTLVVGDPAQRTHEIVADLANGAAQSRFLQLRVTYSSVLDWAPALVGLWAEYEVLDFAPRRRRWRLQVRARDGVVGRDGAVEPRDGRALAADLWDAWAAATTVPFKDIDHAATGLVHQVRISVISEEIAATASGGRAESVISLALVEV